MLLDLPGFGASPLPPDAWGTADYADAVAEWLGGIAGRAAHLGRRIRSAAASDCSSRRAIPELVDGLFLIAAAGLPPQRSLAARVRVAARRWAFRLARGLTPEGPARDRLRERFGSADYRQAGRDAADPGQGGQRGFERGGAGGALPGGAGLRRPGHARRRPKSAARLNALMPQSRLVVLRGFDHWTVLTDGRHQIAQRLSEFLEQLA